MDYKNLSKIKYWGASTAAHQVEGGTHNQWSVWELESASELAKNAKEKYSHLREFPKEALEPENYISGLATGHYTKYEEDFQILNDLNMNAFRFSIEWSRIEPEEGKWDGAELEHYRQYIKALRARGIEPFATMWHWTMPVWFTEMGGFEKRSNVKFFVRFVSYIMEELGKHIDHVIVLNEPNVYSGLGYNDGEWPPQEKSFVKYVMVQQNLIKAQKECYKAIKNIKPTANVGAANQAAYIYTESETLMQRTKAWFERFTWNYWFWDRAEGSFDFVGLNYYFADRWMSGLRPENKNENVSDLGWDMQPDKIENVIVDLHERYAKPVFITENGLADTKDQYRQWWIEETLQALERAMGKGAEIGGYLYWSLLDNFEWADGFWPRFGLVEVDYKTLKRIVRPSAKWFAQELKKIRDD